LKKKRRDGPKRKSGLSLWFATLHTTRTRTRRSNNNDERIKATIMGGRRKNPHPKRAVNVKTVLKGDEKEERGRGEEKEGDEELRLLRMLRCGSP
jgi:hypothetical protein